MSRNAAADLTSLSNSDASRPRPAQTSKSFSRFEPKRPNTPSRSRASTLQNEVLRPEKSQPLSVQDVEQAGPGDVFENAGSEDQRRPANAVVVTSPSVVDGFPEGFDELPIELISLTDRFVASLTNAKVYATPPSIDRLSDLFQDFYLQAELHISTHIQALSSRQYRDASPAPSISSRASANTKGNSKLRSKESTDLLVKPERSAPEQQMLTPSEISERRRARRLLEHKRLALEEAVERRVCEGIYDKIWRHIGTLDEVRDEKLRSRTAALALVGIGLKDLGIDFDGSDRSISSAELAVQTEEWISKAREGLLLMNDSHNPLGKLQHLAQTHQNIVSLLTKIHQSSSSADEILPTLIYTLITSPPEGVNVISNLHFIQRFRSANKINGEAAYCLTNLEAAITFLETVDLATLRSDEPLEGPAKNSGPPTPSAEATNPLTPKNPAPASPGSPITAAPATTPLTAVPNHKGLSMTLPHRSSTGIRPSSPILSGPISPSHQHRLSNLFQPPANALGAASDAVRTTADQGFRNISNTLDNSFKLLFGRLREQDVKTDGTSKKGTIIVPKTLDDARRLVSPRPSFDDDANLSEASSNADPTDDPLSSSPRLDDRILDLISGRKAARDHSADSAKSNASNKRVAFTSDSRHGRANSASLPQLPTSNPTASASNAAVESMRNLGNSLNPLNRFAGMNVMRGFGRSPIALPAQLAPVEAGREHLLPPVPVEKPALQNVEPPVQRFLEINDGAELRVGDIAVLLRDYQRLAAVIRAAGLCQ